VGLEPTGYPRTEWKSRAAFAEVAEAVGRPTNEIMAATPVEDGWLVMYSEGVKDSSTIHRALLERDAEGVLHITKHATCGTVAEFIARANEEIGARLKDEIGF
jgi:hypothetical protein